MTFRKLAAPVLVLALVAACSRKGDIETEGGVGIHAVRTVCPYVAVPSALGDVTLFNPANSTDASAIDVVATLTNVRATCDEASEQVTSAISFDVLARRSDTRGERTVTLPYFVTVVQGGTNVVAKRVSNVTLHFADGAARASAVGEGSATVARSAATLPPEVRKQLTRKRKAGQEAAAVDPLSAPGVRTAVLRASFEALVGFQLTDAQLKYNATR